MAFLIPDNLRSRKDVADPIRRVAGAFQVAFEDDATVWYEPLFDQKGDKPHLVVLDPRLGVLVIEVLKGGANALLGALRGKIRVEVDGREQEVDDPLERATRFAVSLREAIASSEVPATPVGAAAVFSGVSRAEAEQLGVADMVDLDHCIFKPDLDDAISESNAAPLLRVFQRTLPFKLGEELGDQALTHLRGLIHPDTVISRPSGDGSSAGQGSLFTPGSGAGTDTIKVMDRRQEALAKSLGSGHRVIRGVAGSGKTLVLVYRARLLARLLPNKRILVTCYTKSLASQLKAQLADAPNVEVVNLDKLMAKALRRAGIQHPGYDGGTEPVARAALEAIRASGGATYRAVMVDEAQDFDTEALAFCLELLEADDPDHQDVVIVADSAQNIFRKNFRWKDAGIKAQGRTRLLRVNYRNTREILEFAHAFLVSDPSITVDEAPDPEDSLTIIPAESAERSGPKPTVIVVPDPGAEVAAVVRLVRERGAERAPSRSIAVLMGGQSGAGDASVSRGRAIVDALRAANVPVFWATDPEHRENKDRVGSADDPVIVSTIHSAKGLEFPTVIVCGLVAGEDATTAQKLLYVGFTRAVDELAVVVAADSPFRADVEAANHP